jgi:hypothetical protein
MKYPGSLSYIPTEKGNQDTEDKVMKKDAFTIERQKKKRIKQQ